MDYNLISLLKGFPLRFDPILNLPHSPLDPLSHSPILRLSQVFLRLLIKYPCLYILIDLLLDFLKDYIVLLIH